MLEQVTAQRFDRRMTSGKTWPCLLECERSDGQEVELVAKFSAGCERREGGLIAEAIAAMLAADLDLPVPEPFVVKVEDSFIRTLPSSASDVAERIRTSSRLAFGACKLPPGFVLWPPGRSIPAAVRQQAAEIFAFDCLVQNPDRRTGNPNLLFDGRSFAIFDHELAFMTTGIIGWQPPWRGGALQAAGQTHVLFAELSGRAYDWSRFEGAWEALSDQRLNDYERALPHEWHANGDIAGQALAYVGSVRDNIRSALAEVSRVLS